MKLIDLIHTYLNENTNKRQVYLEKWQGGFWWLVDAQTGEPIDGDKRKYVVLNMAKRWNMKIIKIIDKT